ncbi:MAG: TRAM domain-containing protein, partial [Pseudomonadales bacterium]|nr:TRAM domain-containing protein [Pseudomonadales bacterium]
MGRVLAIEGMSHDGRGIVRVDGKVGFVEGALPDEEVEAQLLRRHRRLDEYRVERVRVPSPDRVVPPCPL